MPNMRISKASSARVQADKNVPVKDRVRLACSVGVVMSGLLLAGDLFVDVSSFALGEMWRDAVGDLRGDGSVRP